MNKEIKRGEIYWVNWNPARGSEQSGLRPALIIQNDVGNKYSPTTIVAALTTADVKTYPFTVRVTAKESGLPKDSTINLAVIMTIDKTRLTDKCGELTEVKIAEVNEAIKESLGTLKEKDGTTKRELILDAMAARPLLRIVYDEVTIEGITTSSVLEKVVNKYHDKYPQINEGLVDQALNKLCELEAIKRIPLDNPPTLGEQVIYRKMEW